MGGGGEGWKKLPPRDQKFQDDKILMALNIGYWSSTVNIYYNIIIIIIL